MAARRIALACAALAWFPGCKDKELPAGKLTPEVRALLAEVPADSKLVAGADLALARSRGLWDGALADAVPRLIAVGHQCGSHLLTEIDRIVVSSPDPQPEIKRLHIVVQGRFSPSGKSCLNEIASLREATATWKDTIAVVTPEAFGPAKGAVTGSPEMLARIEKADTSGVVWLAADTRGVAGAVRLPMPAELRGAAISIVPHGDGVAATARIEVDSEDRAKSTAEAIRQQKDSVKKVIPDQKLSSILGRIEITQQGAELALEVTVDRAELDHLLGMRAMLGGS
jgi:hypothetical protein